jgi:hypothetical protein
MKQALALALAFGSSEAQAANPNGHLVKVPVIKHEVAAHSPRLPQLPSAPAEDLTAVVNMIGRLHFIIDQNILGECQPELTKQGANLGSWFYKSHTVRLNDPGRTSISFGPSVIDSPGGYTFLLQRSGNVLIMDQLSDNCSTWLEIKTFANKELNEALSTFTVCGVTELGVKGGGELLAISCRSTVR